MVKAREDEATDDLEGTVNTEEGSNGWLDDGATNENKRYSKYDV